MSNIKLPFIIGISGKIGSGKDYIAHNIIGKFFKDINLNVIHLAFGDPVKVNLISERPDIANFENMYINKSKETRALLQEYSMEMRKKNDKIWIQQLDAWINIHCSRGVNVIIISDVRFPIEVDFIHKKGGMVFRVISPNRTLEKMKEECNEDLNKVEEFKNHISETALDNYPLTGFDGVLFNDSYDIIKNMNSPYLPILEDGNDVKDQLVKHYLLNSMLDIIDNKK